MTRNRTRTTRPGYTLVEILVVMTLIILLAALALGVSQSGLFGSQKVISAGDRASGWLLIAKQRAMRDGAPRGVRFYNTVGGVTGNVNAFTEAAYIEVPEPWVPNQAQEGNPNGARIVFVYPWLNDTATPPKFASFVPPDVYYVGTTADLDEYDQRVAIENTLILPEFGKSFRITNVNAGVSSADTFLGNPIPANKLTLANSRRMVLASMPDLSAAGSLVANTTAQRLATLTTYKFGFQRPAQPLLGEPALQLTGGTSIDFRPGPNTDSQTVPAVAPPYNPTTTIGVNAQADPAAPTGGLFFDILFSPSGQVLNNNAGLICLWVRDTSKGKDNPRASGNDCDDPVTLDAAGQMVLVVINTRNGLLSTQPVNPSVVKNPPPSVPPALPTYDPYKFAKDGINSGL